MARVYDEKIDAYVHLDKSGGARTTEMVEDAYSEWVERFETLKRKMKRQENKDARKIN